LNEKLDIGINIDEECGVQQEPENQEEVNDAEERSKSVLLPSLPVELYESE
jgi:hypothetical protein